MRRENDILARASALNSGNNLCVAENLIVVRRLVHLAHFEGCAGLDAAMHVRKSWNHFRNCIRIWKRTGAASPWLQL